MSGDGIRAAGLRFREQASRICVDVDQQQTLLRTLNTRYRAFSHQDGDIEDTADRMAAELAAGVDRGPLHGITVGVEGCLAVAGLPWTEGCASHAARLAERDAAPVAALRAAGAVVLGTTTLGELALDALENAFEPLARNPWNTARHAGGAGSGAAVATSLGLGRIHLAIDGDGSVRRPACHCGVVGYAASTGRVPLDGFTDRRPTLTRPGLLGRSVDDVRLAAGALLGGLGAGDATGALLVPGRLVAQTADAATRTLFAQACARLTAAGWRLIDGEVAGWLAAAEAAACIGQAEFAAHVTADDLTSAGGQVRDLHRKGLGIAPAAAAAAQSAMAAFAANLSLALDERGAVAVLTPASPRAAPRADGADACESGDDVYLAAADAARAPAVSLPAGMHTEAQVPFGVQLLAPVGADDTLLALAARAERGLGRLEAPPALWSAPTLTALGDVTWIEAQAG